MDETRTFQQGGGGTEGPGSSSRAFQKMLGGLQEQSPSPRTPIAESVSRALVGRIGRHGGYKHLSRRGRGKTPTESNRFPGRATEKSKSRRAFLRPRPSENAPSLVSLARARGHALFRDASHPEVRPENSAPRALLGNHPARPTNEPSRDGGSSDQSGAESGRGARILNLSLTCRS